MLWPGKLSQDLNLKATHIRECFLILTTGQTLAISGCWWPSLLTLMDPVVQGGGTTGCVSQVLRLAPGPCAAAEHTQLPARLEGPEGWLAARVSPV